MSLLQVDFATNEIFVATDYDGISNRVVGPPRIDALDTEKFFLDLRDAEASEGGAGLPRICNHDLESTLSGVIYVQKIEILSPYFVTFDPGFDRVLFEASNNNIVDVSTVNAVQLVPQNSAGLQKVVSGSGVTQQDKDDIENQIFARIIEGGFSFEQIMRFLGSQGAANIEEQSDGTYVIKSIDGGKNRIEGQRAANGGRTISSRDAT